MLPRARRLVTRAGLRFSPCSPLAAVLVVVACAPAISLQPQSDRYTKCGARSQRFPVGAGRVALVGAVHRIDDETAVDGPVRLVIIDPRGDPRKLVFGSLFTRPGPSPQRQATYRVIASSRTGDCVRAVGTMMSGGQVAIEEFDRLDGEEWGEP
jgi:hypothetical protein